MSQKVHKAVDLCEEILDELALLSLEEHEFVASSRTRVEAVRAELTREMIVSDRQISILREIGAGIETRQRKVRALPPEPMLSDGPREKLLH